MKTHVYIHTRDRFDFLDIVLPKWLEQESVSTITLVVEPQEKWPTLRHIKPVLKNARPLGIEVRVEGLPKSDQGMGWARGQALAMAQSEGHRRIIMSDDDLYPKDDVSLLIKALDEPEVIGCGVAVPFYGISLGNDFLRETNQTVPVSGSWGYRCFAVDVEDAIGAGKQFGLEFGFDPALDVGWEDQELCRVMIKAYKAMWHIHTGVMANSIGARYSPGGIDALLPDRSDREAREKECHRHIWNRWGEEFISDPSKPYRCQMMKMLKAFGVIGPDERLLPPRRK